MISIVKFKVLENKMIHFNFSDNTEKTIDFSPFIGEDKLSKPFSNPEYFSKVELYEHGRGIYWPNDYNFCPDFLRKYQPAEIANIIVKKLFPYYYEKSSLYLIRPGLIIHFWVLFQLQLVSSNKN